MFRFLPMLFLFFLGVDIQEASPVPPQPTLKRVREYAFRFG